MKARTSILTAGAVVALVAPAPGSARVLPIKYGKIAKGTKHKVVSRCICVSMPSAPAALSVDEIKAAYDADLIAHGLDPVYSTADGAASAG